MEKLGNSLFNGFENHKLSNLEVIRAGECTGGGGRRLRDNTIVCWDSDDTSGGKTTYYGVHHC